MSQETEKEALKALREARKSTIEAARERMKKTGQSRNSFQTLSRRGQKLSRKYLTQPASLLMRFCGS
ncbi:MAG: hypothetical protein ACP5M0_10265 [Desulfomonilaceae bacterium]